MTKNNDLKAGFEEWYNSLHLYSADQETAALDGFQAGAKFERERIIEEIQSQSMEEAIARGVYPEFQDHVTISFDDALSGKQAVMREIAGLAQAAIVAKLKGSE